MNAKHIKYKQPTNLQFEAVKQKVVLYPFNIMAKL